MLGSQITKGEVLLNTDLSSPQEFEAHQAEFFTWNDYSRTLIKRLFTGDDLLHEFMARGPSFIRDGLGEQMQGLLDDIRGDLRGLRSIRARLELFEEPQGGSMPAGTATETVPGDMVFVVHGRDDGVKSEVARAIESLGLRAVILHEHADGGRTLIEKFEQESAGAGFAVVLLTGDDMGFLNGGVVDMHMRARQNVVLEFGYFLGMLGRPRVRALYQDGVELPSDIDGLVYIPLDKNGAWRTRLAREMQAAGLPVDMNRLR